MGQEKIRVTEILHGDGPITDQTRHVVALEVGNDQETISVVNEAVANAIIWKTWADDPAFGLSTYGPDAAPNPSTAARLNRAAAKRILKLKHSI